MARKKKDRAGRVTQLRQAYQLTKQNDPRIGLILALIVVVVVALFVGLGFLLGSPIFYGITGVFVGVLLALIVFGRRAERSAIRQIADQPGAAAAVLQTLGKGWIVNPGVAANRNQDLVHRVVGRAGVVLVAEGAPSRVTHLLAAEKRKTARVIGDAPMHEIMVGSGDGQVSLRKLSLTVKRLPKPLRPSDVTDLNNRLRALNAMNTPVAIPKGPLPKGVKLPKAPKA